MLHYFTLLLLTTFFSLQAIAANRVILKRNFLHKSLMNKKRNFKKIKSNIDAKGITHTRYQQTYLGIPVYGEQIITHGKQGKVESITGVFVDGLKKDLKNKAQFKLKNNKALFYVKEIFQKENPKKALWTYSNEKVEQVIFLKKNNQARFAYHVNFLAENQEAEEPMRPYYIIDAETKAVLDYYDGLAHAEGIGPGGNEKTGRYQYGVDFPAFEVQKDEDNCTMETDKVKSISLNHRRSGISTPFSYTCPENLFKEINGAYAPINDVHFFGLAVFRMFKEWANTEPLPFQLTLKVHYGNDYENAFWNGREMTFGDGATRFYPLIDMNVTAHEVSHGFTEFNSGLVYRGESGGMNESYSDIAGEAGEFFLKGSVDWGVGSDIFKSSGSLRYFKDPTQDGKSIGHASDYNSGMDVHYSSGIFNRAYYLISTSPNWDPKKGFLIFTHANQNYWTANSTFIQGACGVINSAIDLGFDWQVVHNAFLEVGVECADLPVDTDGDGMRDLWERRYGLNPEDASDANLDNDNDELTNIEEYNHRTNPILADSDQDGLNDGVEVRLGTKPDNSDSDLDGMIDGWEFVNGLDPLTDDAKDDLDGDGVQNILEYKFGTNPNDANSIPRELSSYLESFDHGIPLAHWSQNGRGKTAWSIDETYGAIRSGKIAHKGTSSITFIALFNDGTLSFDYKTSTEKNYDHLTVWLDGKKILNASGEQDWSTHSLEITKGYHEMEFRYEKDLSTSRGEDAVWIDNVKFE